MEAQSEDSNYCEIFFRGINEMVLERSCNQKSFNPINIQFDEHSITKPRLKAVFGEEFVETRTIGCEYHVQKSVDKHKKFFNDRDGESFNIIVTAMKNSVTEDGFDR